MKLIRLEAENIKRLRAVSIDLGDGVTMLGGRNEQGKSSVLDCFAMALGGTKYVPDVPIRRGEKKGRIRLRIADQKLDELIQVERTFNAKGGTKLIIRNRAGVEQKAPQGILDAMLGRLSFDPFEFGNQAPKEQLRTILSLVGAEDEFARLESERRSAYDERVSVNRDVKRLTGAVSELPQHDAPAEEVSVSDLTLLLDEMRDVQASNDRVRAALRQAETDQAAAVSTLERASSDVERMRAALREAEENLLRLGGDVEVQASATAEAKATVARLIDPEPEPVRKQLAEAEETNHKVRANQYRASREAELELAQDNSEELTKSIQAIERKKLELFKGAELPVDGLGFDDDGPTHNGLPLSQASQARRVRIGVAIAIASNPGLRLMLVRQGAYLDDGALELLKEQAIEHEMQVLVERVGKLDESAIIIEDGMVEASE